MRTEGKEKRERVQCTMFREAPEVLSIEEKAGCEISAAESGDGKEDFPGTFHSLSSLFWAAAAHFLGGRSSTCSIEGFDFS